MLGQLLSNLYQALFGQAISSTSGLQRVRPFRVVGRVLLVLLFGWLAVVSLLLWHGPTGPESAWAEVAGGAPPWIYAAPALAAVCALLALIGRPGFFWLSAYAGFVLLFAYLGAVIVIPGDSKDVGLPVVLGIIAVILVNLIALLMAFGDTPALSDPMAHVAYLGRYGHLTALVALGRRYGWEIRGPERTGGTLELHGGFAGREVLIQSLASFKLSTDSASSFGLAITLPARQPVLPLFVGRTAPEGKAWKAASKRTVALGRMSKVRVYLRPMRGQAPPIMAWERIEALVKAGAPYLGPRRVLRGNGQALVWRVQNAARLTAKDAQLEPTLVWLAESIATLEGLSARM